MKEIREFHNRNIPLAQYPEECRKLRSKINMVANMVTNIVKRNYLNNTITGDDYKFYMKVIEQQRRNYQKQVNSI
ncbi:MAG: hypothetical protein IJ629_00425 [Clostridia bacterium]|nr:hypothetical protein [Clostridia bacterium]